VSALRRLWPWPLAALVVAAGVAVALAWTQRLALAEWIAVRALAARGARAELRVVRLDRDGLGFDDLRVGAPDAPDLTIAHATLAWSWAGLRAGRVERIDVTGVRLRARVGEGGVSLGSLDPLLSGGGGGAAALPFLEARFSDLEARIDSAQGPLVVRAEGRAVPEGDLVRVEGTAHGESQQGTLDAGGGATFGLVSEEIAGAAALRGITPWGAVEANLVLAGTRAKPAIAFRGSFAPDAKALGIESSEPIAAEGNVTLDDAGAPLAQAKVTAKALDAGELGRARGVRADLDARGSPLISRADVVLDQAEIPDVATLTHVAVKAERTDATVATVAIRAVDLPDLARLASVGAEVRVAGDAIDADVRVAELHEISKPPLIATLRGEAKLRGTLDDLAVRGSARTPGDGLVFAIEGRVSPRAGTADLAIHLPETSLDGKERQPLHVFPWLEGLLEAAKGTAGLEAHASYAKEELAASAVVALKDVDVRTPYATLRRLNGLITVTGPDPLVTPPGQRLSIGAVEELPLANGVVEFELVAGETLRIAKGTFQFAGGELELTGDVPLAVENRSLLLRASALSVEQLLASLEMEELSGTGSLDGAIPVEQHGDDMRVVDGELHATAPGVIRYAGGEGAASLARKQPALAPLLGALENLQYDELTLTLSGGLADKMDVKVHIRGRNPNFQKGRPVVLNVNVEAPVGSLLRAGLTATSVPEEIEGQVQRFFDQEKK
jgi:hypothetical protein